MIDRAGRHAELRRPTSPAGSRSGRPARRRRRRRTRSRRSSRRRRRRPWSRSRGRRWSARTCPAPRRRPARSASRRCTCSASKSKYGLLGVGRARRGGCRRRSRSGRRAARRRRPCPAARSRRSPRRSGSPAGGRRCRAPSRRGAAGPSLRVWVRDLHAVGAGRRAGRRGALARRRPRPGTAGTSRTAPGCRSRRAWGRRRRPAPPPASPTCPAGTLTAWPSISTVDRRRAGLRAGVPRSGSLSRLMTRPPSGSDSGCGRGGRGVTVDRSTGRRAAG